MKTSSILIICLISCFVNASEDVKSKTASAINYNNGTGGIYFESQDEGIKVDDSRIKFYLNEASTKINNGYRSEVAIFDRFELGSKVKYIFTLTVNKISQKTITQDNSWFIVAQWHDQPNKELGETWSSFPKRPPPLSFGIDYKKGYKLYFKSEKNYIDMDIRLGSTIFCAVEIEWIFSKDGAISGKCRTGIDNMKFSFKDRTMHNRYYHYFKFGIYNGPTVKGKNEVTFKNLNINPIEV
ncbi:heparin lyase I family protein [Salinimonas sediminis]|uniref:Polysaccharide lyase n=1 Tax=Salinimonas sediminis TaxID=2303538 RepID=A0A346NMW0_9ALTE|nr:heparin lyase I family protein [Salinimonas sediminis]AXR06867.1 hypothetical protein D0Y50_11160 [Salinimonas sediminis]